MIPAPITELDLNQKLVVEKIKRELQTRDLNTEDGLKYIVFLLEDNLRLKSNVAQLVKYIATGDLKN